MSKAVVFTQYGGPQVLHIINVEAPKAGPKQIRVHVKAAGVQPFDCLFRSGAAHQWMPAAFPQRLGNEFAGIIDQVGEGVTAFSAGDEVIGWAILGSVVEHVVVPASDVVAKPADMPWPEAGALSASGQTASTALDRLRVVEGDTVLIHAAAGGVGSFAVQIAKARGTTVIGTASERNLDYLRSLGATPVLYGNGLVQRVRAVAPLGVDATLIAVASEEALHASRELTRDKARIGTVAFQPLAEKLGIARLSTERSAPRLSALTKLYAEGRLRISIQKTFRFEEAADAHRLVESGHVRGKIVLLA